MTLSITDMDSLAALGALKLARQKALIREAVTRGQLAHALNVSKPAITANFISARVREGRGFYETLYSRAAVIELLSTWNGRPVAFPSEPLMKGDEGSAFLATHGVHLTEFTMRWYRSQKPHLAPPFVRVFPYDNGKVRYVQSELAAWAAARNLGSKESV